MQKYKGHIALASLLLGIVAAFYVAGEILLPFVLGLGLAWLAVPSIKRIQRFIPNRNLAVTVLLLVAFLGTTGVLALFGNQLAHDFKRLNNAFVLLLERESETIDQTTSTVKSYLEELYTEADLQEQFSLDAASDSTGLSLETVQESLAKVGSFLGSDDGEEAEESDSGYSWLGVVGYTLLYFLYIVYTWTWFEERIDRYIRQDRPGNAFMRGIVQEFNAIFSTYFRQRTKVVLWCMAIFLATFLIMGMPGAVLLAVLAGVLCYVANFHYVTLIPLALTCWALSIETGNSFWLYFGIVAAVFVVVSVLEELVFFPYIMKGVANMNPAVMLLAFAFWPFLLGTVGVFLALPLTAAVQVLGKRALAVADSNSSMAED